MNGTDGGTSTDGGSAGNPCPDSSDSDTVSRGAIFGLFLTLGFCLVSQPYGSLVFRSRFGVFWRLNPLSCSLEAATIVVDLLVAAASSLRKQRRPGSSLESAPFHVPWRQVAKELWADLHATSAALLLVRANADGHRDESPLALLLEATAHDQSTGLSTARSAVHYEPPTPSSPPPPGSLPSTDSGATTNINSAVVPPRQDHPVAVSTGTSSGHGPSVARRSTAQLEQGPEPPAPSESQSQQTSGARLEAFRTALGANAFTHRELPVHIVTFLSAAGAAVKLCANTIPLAARIAGIFMLASWLSLQALLVVFHATHIGDEQMARIVRSTRDLLDARAWSRRRSFRALLPLFLTIPPLLYLSILVAVGRTNRDQNWNFVDVVLDAPTSVVLVLAPVVFLSTAYQRFEDAPSWTKAPGFHITLLSVLDATVRIVLFFCSLLFFSCYWMIRFDPNPESPIVASNSPPEFLITVGYYFYVVIIVPALLFACSGLLVARMPPRDRDDAVFVFVVQVLDLVVTTVVFSAFLAGYEEEGTYQPEWVSWFG